MLRHHLLLTFRNFKRNQSSFFINLIGLSTGLACVLLIYLWVTDELSVDKFHEKDARLYQVMQNLDKPNEIYTDEGTPGLLAKTMKAELPEVEYATTVVPAGWFENEGVLTYGDLRYTANEQYVSRDYFDIFSYQLIDGDQQSIHLQRHHVLISDEMALKIFGTTRDVVGKSIDWEREWGEKKFTGPYTISGIFKSPPKNATDQFDMIFGYEIFYDQWKADLDNWRNSNPITFITLHPGTHLDSFNAKIANFLKSEDRNPISTLFLKKYSKRYLFNKYSEGEMVGGRILYVRLFSIVALIILLIACINYMNLSTAKASKRITEVSIKKAVGASRKRLVVGHIGESFIMSFISVVLAALLVFTLLPSFNEITGKSLSVGYYVIWLCLGLILLVTILAAAYPSFYLTGFNPAKALKGSLRFGGQEPLIRKGLVIFQFAASSILISSVLVLLNQVKLINEKDPGFQKEHVIRIERVGELENNLEPFLTEIKKIPGVESVSNSGSDLMGNHGTTIGGITYEDWDAGDQTLFAYLDVNYDFIPTMGIEMKDGRDFSRKFNNEHSKIILNEEAVRQMGIEDPVGKSVKYQGRDRQIIGITKNFHFESFHEEIKPLFFRLMPHDFNWGKNIWVKIIGNSAPHVISEIQQVHKSFNPDFPFEFRFLDQDFEKLYTSENKMFELIKYFSGLAIIISCLGLVGLAAFTAERKNKEIGIRKVLGSNELGIVRLLTHEFSKMVLAAILIGVPISYFIADQWLQTFAYHIDLSWRYFAGAGLLTLLIAWLTVGFQTIKAAMVNPAKILRSE